MNFTKILTIAAVIASTLSPASAGTKHEYMLFPGVKDPGVEIDQRCTHLYNLGWNRFETGDRTYYVLFCKIRGYP